MSLIDGNSMSIRRVLEGIAVILLAGSSVGLLTLYDRVGRVENSINVNATQIIQNEGRASRHQLSPNGHVNVSLMTRDVSALAELQANTNIGIKELTTAIAELNTSVILLQQRNSNRERLDR